MENKKQQNVQMLEEINHSQEKESCEESEMQDLIVIELENNSKLINNGIEAKEGWCCWQESRDEMPLTVKSEAQKESPLNDKLQELINIPITLERHERMEEEEYSCTNKDPNGTKQWLGSKGGRKWKRLGGKENAPEMMNMEVQGEQKKCRIKRQFHLRDEEGKNESQCGPNKKPRELGNENKHKKEKVEEASRKWPLVDQ